MQSFAQTRYLTVIPSLSTDTVLVLDRVAAVNQGNFNLTAISLRNRFIAALERERKLTELWAATSAESQIKTEIISNKIDQILNLEAQIESQSNEIELFETAVKKGKRKSLLKGIGIGFVGGVLLTAYIMK